MKIVQSKVRAELKGIRASGDFFTGLDKKITAIIKDAVERAKKNGRKTVRDYDL